jgi:hypothetical protein
MCKHRKGTVELQLAWQLANYCTVCGVRKGRPIDLKDKKKAKVFGERDQSERHENNRQAVLAASR